MFESRAKAEADLIKFHKDVKKSVNNTEVSVRVEGLVTYCEDAMAKAFFKNEQPLELAQKTSDPESVKADLEKSLNVITAQNNEILISAREYIEPLPYH